MKKLTAFVLTICFMFSLVGQAGAIYNPPSRVTPTKEDLAVATAFFNGIKFDTSDAQNNIIKITIPKIDSKYAFSMFHQTMKENGEPVDSYMLNLKLTGGEVKTVNILPGYTTRFWLYLGNDNTSAVLLDEVWTYTPGDSQVRYVPFKDRIIPIFEDGNITGYVNGNGTPINEDGTPIDSQKPDLAFKDVPTNHWAFTVIKELAAAGYIKGYPDKTFQPEGNITRAEYMVMLANVLKDKWPEGSTYDHSSENSILPAKHWSNDTVNLAFKYMPFNSIEQIFQADLQPDKKITREEVVAVLMSILTNNPNFGAATGTSQNFLDQALSKFPTAIDFAASKGLVSGYPDGTFKPGGNITRAEIAAVMIKVLGKLNQGGAI
jgi:hypothetical protein